MTTSTSGSSVAAFSSLTRDLVLARRPSTEALDQVERKGHVTHFEILHISLNSKADK